MTLFAAPQQPPPQSAGDDNTTPKETTYSDPSGAIFSMYITRALKFDDETVENWKIGADGILVFVRFCTFVCLQALTVSRLVFSLLR